MRAAWSGLRGVGRHEGGAGRLRHLRGALRIAAAEQHPRALRGKTLDDAAAEAAGPAGDDGRLSFKAGDGRLLLDTHCEPIEARRSGNQQLKHSRRR